MSDNINENETKKKSPTKNKKVLIPLLLLLVVVIGTSFALWQLTFTQSGTNIITTGCLKLTLTEDTDAINITDAVPTSDADGKTLNPFTFTLENVCTTETSYVVNLETVSSGSKILADNYVKANLVSGENELFIDNLLETHINEEKVIEEATTAYKLHQGKLGNKEKISFSLRLWMDEATPADDTVMEALWQGKITVTANYIPSNPTKNMMVAMEIEETEVYGNGDVGTLYTNKVYCRDDYNLSKVVFQSQINPYNDAKEVVDFSVAQDNSVVGYYVKDLDETSNDTYTLYIQADGKIKVNYNASYYFLTSANTHFVYQYNSAPFEGLENLDTSLVTNMSRMFDLSSMEAIDLSSWDTQNVTNMTRMFSGCSSLKVLDLSNFDTGDVTNMDGMFSGCSSLTGLDLSNFDTGKVTNMDSMFSGCSSLTGLDLSNFDTGNVTNMDSMFSHCNNLTSLNLRNFNTSSVINMARMFFNCSGLTSLDLSNFDTSSVIDMARMFSGCRNLTSLVLSNFDTSNVTNMVGTFAECSNITSLDLSNFDTKKVTDMQLMFYKATNLTTITYGSNFIHSQQANTTDMFNSCPANKPTDSSWSEVTF